eukprot:scaffold35409_cov73-Isochrysis_galbana.AAC.1
MAAALEARYLSALKSQRTTAAHIHSAAAATALHEGIKVAQPLAGWAEALEDALLASKLCSYAQGFALLAAASKAHDWNLDFEMLSTIWRGGCIIRAKVLQVRASFPTPQKETRHPLSPPFASPSGVRFFPHSTERNTSPSLPTFRFAIWRGGCITRAK